ncbi:hypothetical protein [Nonomuraea jiangxiensis]|uniref:Uncharacterized protein n=1 Tax=Nonomuraea jiangxiensis TaxID=633440 RepID=A0A1G9MTZ7_9ACTN|nr:hypothetical protein [Nonomuraea jiangxiensis]SDL77105.1 hypothetical protein SAMN05421869_130101 [Nonomuraea jiangxiensis]
MGVLHHLMHLVLNRCDALSGIGRQSHDPYHTPGMSRSRQLISFA